MCLIGVTETWDNDVSILEIKYGKTTLPLSLIVQWFVKHSYICFQFAIRDIIRAIFSNWWYISIPFYIYNLFIWCQKILMPHFGVGKFITQVRLIYQLGFFNKFIRGISHFTYIIMIMELSSSINPFSVFTSAVSHGAGDFLITNDYFVRNVLGHYIQKHIGKK